MLRFQTIRISLLLLSAFQVANAADPLRITSCQDLQNIGANLDGEYYLDNDIDCAGFPFKTIPHTFTGKLDGQNYTIHNLVINAAPNKRGGLFAALNEAEVTNLHFQKATVHADDQVERGLLASRIARSSISNIVIHQLHIPGRSTYVSKQKGSTSGYTGGLTGYAEWTHFYNIQIHHLTLQHHTYTGGIAGSTLNVSLDQCGVYQVKSTLDPAREYPATRDRKKLDIESGGINHDKSGDRRKEYDTAMGGLMGYVSQGATTVTNSRSSGNIAGPLNIGGLIGLNDYLNELNITHSYSIMNVTAEKFAGGIIGRAGDSDYLKNIRLTTLNNVYAAGKVNAKHHARSLVGNKDNGGHSSHVRGRETYFDKIATGRIHPGMKHVHAVTSEQLTYNQPNTLRSENGWVLNIWTFEPNEYPTLYWE